MPRRPPKPADPDSTLRPDATAAAQPAPARKGPPPASELRVAILRYLRRWPNATVELGPLAAELGVAPEEMQLAAERLNGRGLVITPFVMPEAAGAATLTEVGLRWLIEQEGGRPRDVPVAYQKASGPVRASDEAARLPRSQVYGPRRT